MSENEPDDPIPGWPGGPSSGAGGSEGPSWPHVPPSAGEYPPPGAYPPVAPPNVVPPSGGYAAPGSGAPGYGAPGYGGAPDAGYGYGGYAGFGYYPTAREHPQGTTILVLGILSLVVCGLLGPVAWYMGNQAIREIDANPAAYTNRGNVQAGRIIGIVATCLVGFVIVVYGGLFLFVALAGSTSS